MTLAHEPNITRHDDSGDVNMTLVERAELDRLRGVEARFQAMLPLFEEARDALCAVTKYAAKLHNISPTLAERMDEVGVPARWAARTSPEIANATTEARR
jgi:hypothetical protein